MIILNINYILNIAITLYLIGVLGLVFNRKNILITLMSIELMLLAINLNFVVFSIYLDDITGYVFVLFILTIAATESAIGLAILTIYYRLKNNIQIEKIKNKLLAFKKKKWQKFQRIFSRLRKKKLYDPKPYFLSNFENFFSRKFKYNLQNKQRLSLFYGAFRKRYLKKVVRSALKEFKILNKHAAYWFAEKLLYFWQYLLANTYRIFCYRVVGCLLIGAIKISLAYSGYTPEVAHCAENLFYLPENLLNDTDSGNSTNTEVCSINRDDSTLSSINRDDSTLSDDSVQSGQRTPSVRTAQWLLLADGAVYVPADGPAAYPAEESSVASLPDLNRSRVPELQRRNTM